MILGSGVVVDGEERHGIFAYSNSGKLSPQNSSAFYINAKGGVALNKPNHAAVSQLDINGGLTLTAYDTSKHGLPLDPAYKGTIALVQKGDEI